MDKDTILDYVTETPGNTNRAVLGSMLDSMSGGNVGFSLPQRIVPITIEDFFACANENNVVNEFDLLEYTIKKHIGVIPQGNGIYLIAYDFSCDNSWSNPLSYPVSVVDASFMGADTSANIAYSVFYTFNGVIHSLSKASELSQNPPTVTIDGIIYKIIKMQGTAETFAVQGQ